MGSAKPLRRLIVNADDFGRSPSINQAVIRAHQEGILTTTSLMVTGDAAAEAVDLARQNPQLGVGLHLTLVCGRCASLRADVPGLANSSGAFSDNAVRVGMQYFFKRSLLPQLRREIAAQFQLFRKTGLALDHVNGHLNLHLHPVVFRILLEEAKSGGWSKMRLTRDLLGLNLRIGKGRWGYRLSHALIFGLLSRWARGYLARANIRHTDRVFGLLESSQIHEAFLIQLLKQLPDGDSELYSHPCLEHFVDEFNALVSVQVRQILNDRQIQLIRYQDL